MVARRATRRTSRGWDSPLLQDPIPGDPVKCLDELGVEIGRVVNDEATGKCPAHVRRTGKQDRHPSWSVNMESGRHNCFSCGFKGPFYLIVKEVLGCSDESAIAWVKARGSIDRAKKVFLGEGSYIQEVEEPQVTEADLALYVDAPEWACYDRDFDPWAADDYGVLWDKDKSRWITPVREPETNALMGWQEKGHEDRYFRNRPMSLKKSTTLFGVNEFKGDTAILVESPLDVVKIHASGFEYMGLSSFGVRVSNTQLSLMVDIGVVHLISALDHDRDGKAANTDLIERVRGRMRLSFWDYSNCDAKDPGDQTDEEIEWSFDHAFPSMMWTPG